MIQVGTVRTARAQAPRAGDGQVETLRVILRAVLVPGRVQRNDLVAQHIVAWGDARGNLHQPGTRIREQHVGGPGSRVGSVQVAHLVDLEELEGGLVHRLAVAIAVGKIIQDGPLVRVGPLHCPLDGNRVTGVDGRVTPGGRSILVADNIARLVGIGRDEAVVGVSSCPAYYDRRVGFVGVRRWVITLPVDAVDDKVVDVAVGNGGVRQDQTAQEGSREDNHRGVVCLG